MPRHGRGLRAFSPHSPPPCSAQAAAQPRSRPSSMGQHSSMLLWATPPAFSRCPQVRAERTERLRSASVRLRRAFVRPLGVSLLRTQSAAAAGGRWPPAVRASGRPLHPRPHPAAAGARRPSDVVEELVAEHSPVRLDEWSERLSKTAVEVVYDHAEMFDVRRERLAAPKRATSPRRLSKGRLRSRGVARREEPPTPAQRRYRTHARRSCRALRPTPTHLVRRAPTNCCGSSARTLAVPGS